MVEKSTLNIKNEKIYRKHFEIIFEWIDEIQNALDNLEGHYISVKNVNFLEIFQKFCEKNDFKNNLEMMNDDLINKLLEKPFWYFMACPNFVEINRPVIIKPEWEFLITPVSSGFNCVNISSMDWYFKNFGKIYEINIDHFPHGILYTLFDNFGREFGVSDKGFSLNNYIMKSYSYFECRGDFKTQISKRGANFSPWFISLIDFKDVFENYNLNPTDKKIVERAKIVMATDI